MTDQPATDISENERIMNQMREEIERFFNGDRQGNDRQVGFALLVFPLQPSENVTCEWVANGVDEGYLASILGSLAEHIHGHLPTPQEEVVQ